MIEGRGVIVLLLFVENAEFEMCGSRARVYIQGFLEHFNRTLIIALLKAIFPGEEIGVLLFIALAGGAGPAPRGQDAEEKQNHAKWRPRAQARRTQPRAQ